MPEMTPAEKRAQEFIASIKSSGSSQTPNKIARWIWEWESGSRDTSHLSYVIKTSEKMITFLEKASLEELQTLLGKIKSSDLRQMESRVLSEILKKFNDLPGGADKNMYLQYITLYVDSIAVKKEALQRVAPIAIMIKLSEKKGLGTAKVNGKRWPLPDERGRYTFPNISKKEFSEIFNGLLEGNRSNGVEFSGSSVTMTSAALQQVANQSKEVHDRLRDKYHQTTTAVDQDGTAFPDFTCHGGTNNLTVNGLVPISYKEGMAELMLDKLLAGNRIGISSYHFEQDHNYGVKGLNVDDNMVAKTNSRVKGHIKGGHDLAERAYHYSIEKHLDVVLGNPRHRQHPGLIAKAKSTGFSYEGRLPAALIKQHLMTHLIEKNSDVNAFWPSGRGLPWHEKQRLVTACRTIGMTKETPGYKERIAAGMNDNSHPFGKQLQLIAHRYMLYETGPGEPAGSSQGAVYDERNRWLYHKDGNTFNVEVMTELAERYKKEMEASTLEPDGSYALGGAYELMEDTGANLEIAIEAGMPPSNCAFVRNENQKKKTLIVNSFDVYSLEMDLKKLGQKKNLLQNSSKKIRQELQSLRAVALQRQKAIRDQYDTHVLLLGRLSTGLASALKKVDSSFEEAKTELESLGAKMQENTLITESPILKLKKTGWMKRGAQQHNKNLISEALNRLTSSLATAKEAALLNLKKQENDLVQKITARIKFPKEQLSRNKKTLIATNDDISNLTKEIAKKLALEGIPQELRSLSAKEGGNALVRGLQNAIQNKATLTILLGDDLLKECPHLLSYLIASSEQKNKIRVLVQDFILPIAPTAASTPPTLAERKALANAAWDKICRIPEKKISSGSSCLSGYNRVREVHEEIAIEALMKKIPLELQQDIKGGNSPTHPVQDFWSYIESLKGAKMERENFFPRSMKNYNSLMALTEKMSGGRRGNYSKVIANMQSAVRACQRRPAPPTSP